MDIDRKRTPSRNFQRGMRNESTLPGCRIQRRFDVVNEPVRSNDGSLRIPQGTAHAYAAPIWQWSRPCASKKRIRWTKLDAVCCLIDSTHSIYIRSDNL